jgi:ribosomal protein L29
MAAIKKNEISKLSKAELEAKLDALERSMLELRGEGRYDKVKSVRHAVAAIKTKLNMLGKVVKNTAKKL